MTGRLGGWVVPGIAHPAYHPGYTPPGTTPVPGMAARWLHAVMARGKYGRGALIRRPSHLTGTLVAHYGYDRDI